MAGGSRGGAAGMQRRRGGGGRAAEAGASSSTMLQFYTDEAPGIKLSPTVVLVMSIGFIAFVAILHVIGKLYLVPHSQILRMVRLVLMSLEHLGYGSKTICLSPRSKRIFACNEIWRSNPLFYREETATMDKEFSIYPDVCLFELPLQMEMSRTAHEVNVPKILDEIDLLNVSFDGESTLDRNPIRVGLKKLKKNDINKIRLQIDL
ncbi:Protein transport protein Sec61 subunit beta [Forsythia ovata]|uniref:Protein transport protein Sec61 subunit beta n=1 Tax=Forsythia ovata TaxID=205694 RepID=A0ABD1SK62_9LAMI